jgi:hypothetical protein
MADEQVLHLSVLNITLMIFCQKILAIALPGNTESWTGAIGRRSPQCQLIPGHAWVTLHPEQPRELRVSMPVTEFVPVADWQS